MKNDISKLPAIRDFLLDYIGLYSEEADGWLRDFHSEPVARLRELVTTEVSKQFQRHNLKGGLQLLSEYEEAIISVTEKRTSIANVLNRRYFGQRAYAKYLSGDIGGAKEDLQLAHNEVIAALSAHFFLVPLAITCIDFTSQHARIARRENRWKDAKDYIVLIRRLYSNEEPFCVLTSGYAVFLSDIHKFFEGLPLNEKERARTTELLGEHIPLDDRMNLIEELVFALPDMVIPYP